MAVAVATAVLAGCAHRPPLISTLVTPGDATRVELVDVVFFPQAQQYQCGPAALATALTTAGVDASPEDLATRIFLPGRRGSLQLELVAATRRYGRIPYVVTPSLGDLLAQVRAGLPVLVLQNLGLESLPVWHYAVVIGFDAAEEILILRSGAEPRLTTAAATFVRTWAGADNWALVVLEPGRLPADPDPERYLRAVAGVEAAGQHRAAQIGYAAALERWPDQPTALLGLGNAHYALGELREAEQVYRRLVAVRPDDVIAHNNLAQTLADRGCLDEASSLIAHAMELAAGRADLHPTVARTHAQIAAADPGAGRPACAGAPP